MEVYPSTPYLLVNEDTLMANIDKMENIFSEKSVAIRPHVKTHKCREIARVQTKEYEKGIMVSTVQEALYFAEDGCKDISYGILISRDKFEKIIPVIELIDTFCVLVDSIEVSEELNIFLRKKNIFLNAMIKIDCGYGRSGLPYTCNSISNLAKKLESFENIKFKGILSHSGNSYSCRSEEAILNVARDEISRMLDVKKIIQEAGIPCTEVSIGSTPTLSLSSTLDFTGITEVRPGNYVFNDGSQVCIGSCTLDDVAITVVSTILGIYPADNKIIIDAGSIALSKDIGDSDLVSILGYGLLVDYLSGEVFNDLNLVSLSQEHGKIIADTGFDFSQLSVGSKLKIVPNHSCLTSSNHKKYVVSRENSTIFQWDICKGW